MNIINNENSRWEIQFFRIKGGNHEEYHRLNKAVMGLDLEIIR